MGFSVAEKEGCTQILNQLGVSDLLHLYETVTKGKTSERNKTELIEAIIKQSKAAVELLNRKKVERSLILKYLNNEKIFTYAKTTKKDAIQCALNHWEKSVSSIPEESEAVDTSQSYLLQVTSTLDSVVGQLPTLMAGLSIHYNREDISHVDKVVSPGVRAAPSSSSGAKPKEKTTSKKSQTTSVSFTWSVTSDKALDPQPDAKKGSRTRKH